MATVQRYANTGTAILANAAGGNGMTNVSDTTGTDANRAFASLSEWEANSGGSATDNYIVDCAGSAADTTAVQVNFTTDLTTGTVTIRGEAAAASSDGKYNGTATISTAHYRLTNSGANALDIRELNFTVDGIQIECGAGAFKSCISVATMPVGTGNVSAVRNCRLRATGSGADVGIGSGNSGQGMQGTITVENNLIVGFSLQGIEMIADNFRNPNWIVRHNTVYADGNANCIKVSTLNSNTTATFILKGNAIANSGASNCFSVSLTGGGTVTYDDNATEDAQGTTGEIAIGTLANAWTTPGTGQSDVFTVKDTGSSLYNAVNPTLVTTDITGYTRDGTNHDVGCFEFQTAGASITPTVGSLTASGVAARNDRGVIGTIGTLALTGVAPSAVQGLLLTPTVGGLVLSGIAGRMDLGLLSSVGALVISGVAPSVTDSGNSSRTVTPLVGALDLAGLSVLNNLGLIGSVGALTISGVTPANVQGRLITPTIGSLTLTGVAPSNGLAILSVAGSLVLVGVAPTLVIPGSTNITPTVGALSLLGLNVTQNYGLISTVGALTLSGIASSLLTGFVLTPQTGTQVITGIQPRWDIGVKPSTGELSLEAVIALANEITPFAGALELVGYSPEAVVFLSPRANALFILSRQTNTFVLGRK